MVLISDVMRELMDSDEGVKELPPEILERVLAPLPVPVLCRLRSVCKAWNELICKPSFHNLHDLNDSDLHLTMEDGLYFEAENLRISDDHPAEVRAFMQEIYGHIEWYLGECYGIERTYPYPYFHTFFDDRGGG